MLHAGRITQSVNPYGPGPFETQYPNSRCRERYHVKSPQGVRPRRFLAQAKGTNAVGPPFRSRTGQTCLHGAQVAVELPYTRLSHPIRRGVKSLAAVLNPILAQLLL